MIVDDVPSVSGPGNEVSPIRGWLIVTRQSGTARVSYSVRYGWRDRQLEVTGGLNRVA